MSTVHKHGRPTAQKSKKTPQQIPGGRTARLLTLKETAASRRQQLPWICPAAAITTGSDPRACSSRMRTPEDRKPHCRFNPPTQKKPADPADLAVNIEQPRRL